MGGWVAETLAVNHPERVSAAAFLGSCNIATAWGKAITTVERDLARLDVDLPPLF
jgi:homoserine acetyltransferase